MSDISLASVLQGAMASRLSQIRVGLPGRILSYDEVERTVSVEILIADTYEDESGDRIVDYPPVLNSVPVMFPGSGGARLTWPLTAGDVCWVQFASSAADLFKIAGGKVDPEDARHHHLSDAFVQPVATLDFKSAREDDIDTSVNIAFTDTEVRLGDNTATTDGAKVALKSDLEVLFSAIENTVIVANDGGASFKTTLLEALENASWPVCATKVKAK